MFSLTSIALTVLLLATGASLPADLAGSWEGSLSFRGDSTAVELELMEEDEEIRALLSLPELVMSLEPVPARLVDDRVLVELPFGIGELALAGAGPGAEETLSASREVGEEEMTLLLHPRSGPAVLRREVVVRSGGATLPGTLVLPPGPGPHPGVVLVHGSGAISRAHWAYRSWADALARRGIAALVYDRRSAEDGTPPPDFATLAEDALAAARLLRVHPEIRRDAVGLMGSSQGGWVAPLAASRSDEIAFLILGAAASVSPGDQEVQRAMGTARASGLTEEDLMDLRNYLRLYFYVARSGRGWRLLEKEIEQAEGSPWGPFVDQPTSLDQLNWWRHHADFSPEAVLPRIGIPVLASWGTEDLMVPPDANAARLESLLRSGGNSDVTIQLIEGGDHRIERPMGRDAQGRWRWPRIAPEYLDSIERWVRERMSGSPGGSEYEPERVVWNSRGWGPGRSYFELGSDRDPSQARNHGYVPRAAGSPLDFI